VVSADDDLELGFFGNREIETHVLVVNRRPEEAREVRLVTPVESARDALSGEALALDRGTLTLSLEAGGMQLIELSTSASGDSGN
jgi:hypothetical protein